MSNAASIVAELKLEKGQFRTAKEQTDADLKSMGATAKETAGAIALLERQLKSDAGNKELKGQISALKSEYRDLTKEIKLAEAQSRRLGEVGGAGLAMPTASRARAVVQRTYTGPAGKEGGHGGGNLAMRNAELMHSGRAIADMMAAGMSPLQALMMEAPRLFQAFASSLGALLAPIALLAGGGMFVKWLHDGQEAAKTLRLETAGIATNMNNVAGASAENLAKTLAAATQQLDKVVAAQGSTGNRILNALTGGGVTKADVGAAMAVRGGIQHRQDETQGRKLELDQRQFAGDPGVEAERLKLEFAEKRNEVYRQVAARQLVDGREAVRQAEAELALKMAILERTQQARQNEVQEETQGTAIRRYGKNVESELARAHLERAQADLVNGPQEGPEYQHNFNQVTTAKTAQEESDKRTREHNADLDRRTRNANLRGSADDVAYQKAVNDRDAIQGKLDDPGTKFDERKGLEAELAEAKAQVRNLAKQSYQKGFEFEKLGIQTEQGRGPEARKEAIEKELDLLEHERKVNKEKNGDDAVVNAQLDAQAHTLRMEKEDIAYAEKEALAASTAQTEEMQLQQSGHEGLAKIEATREQYQQRILEAQRLGKTALAEQLQLQQKIAMDQARMAAYASTPGQQAAQRSQQRAIAQAKERFERDDGLQSIRRGIDGRPIDGYDPLLQRRRAFGDHSAFDPKTGTPLPGQGPDAGKGTAENPNDIDGAFDRRFHPDRVQPDRRAAANADPQTTAGDGKGGDAEKIVKAINRPEWAKDLTFKNQ